MWKRERLADTLGAKMSKMKELYYEHCLDFERLNETSMRWEKEVWGQQVADGRFEGQINWADTYIYWFDNYACLMAARNILQMFGEQYSEIFDDHLGQWCMTSTYQDMVWAS
jgi:hypothetical protein